MFDNGCATVLEPTTGAALVETCQEGGVNPSVLWSGPVGETYYALVRAQTGSQIESVAPSTRYAQLDSTREIAVVELGRNPATTAVIR